MFEYDSASLLFSFNIFLWTVTTIRRCTIVAKTVEAARRGRWTGTVNGPQATERVVPEEEEVGARRRKRSEEVIQWFGLVCEEVAEMEGSWWWCIFAAIWREVNGFHMGVIIGLKDQLDGFRKILSGTLKTRVQILGDIMFVVKVFSDGRVTIIIVHNSVLQ